MGQQVWIRPFFLFFFFFYVRLHLPNQGNCGMPSVPFVGALSIQQTPFQIQKSLHHYTLNKLTTVKGTSSSFQIQQTNAKTGEQNRQRQFTYVNNVQKSGKWPVIQMVSNWHLSTLNLVNIWWQNSTCNLVQAFDNLTWMIGAIG